MRVASFHVASKEGKQADVGVVPLPGLIGRDLENVNRWRGTVGLAPVKEEDLPQLAERIPVAGLTADLYDQAGENTGSGEKTRILAAVLRREGVAWFFKMSGDDELVAQQKPAFTEFLKSLTFPEATGQAALPPDHPAVGTDMGTMGGTGGMMPPNATAGDQPASTEGRPAWEIPAGWQEVPAGQFLLAKFAVSGAEGAQASVNISMSAGSGGGLLANVNRWRGQLGLGPWSESDLSARVQAVDIEGGKASFVDLTGTDPRSGKPTRLVGAIVPQAAQTWFYKLMGGADLVEQQKETFSRFVKTTKYSNAH